jgi:hypothetical protein
MGKTYRGSDKDYLKDKYKQVRDERQHKRHVGKDEQSNSESKTDGGRVGDRYGSNRQN